MLEPTANIDGNVGEQKMGSSTLRRRILWASDAKEVLWRRMREETKVLDKDRSQPPISPTPELRFLKLLIRNWRLSANLQDSQLRSHRKSGERLRGPATSSGFWRRVIVDSKER